MKLLEERGLSLEDVYLEPGFYQGSSRMDVDISPYDLPGYTNPIVSANMNGVTGKRMAEAIARYGGVGILPQDMSLEKMEEVIGFVKAASPFWDTALTVSVRTTIRETIGIIYKRSHGLVCVVDEKNRLLGIVTPTDLENTPWFSEVAQAISKGVVTLTTSEYPTNDPHLIYQRMEEERVRACPLLGNEKEVLGVITKEDVIRQHLMKPSFDAHSRLKIGAAIGVNQNLEVILPRLIEKGVDIIVLDTAHGHQQKMIDAIRRARVILGVTFPIVAGNVCTRKGVADLLHAGADIIKVNVGPGAMCTTRMQTGVGTPSFTAVAQCAEQAHALGGYVWADGGVQYPRDVALYLAAGASRVMVGTLLSGTYESPGELREDAQGKKYKENFGMASHRAVYDRNIAGDAFQRACREVFREGVSSSKVYQREGAECVGSIMMNLLSGLRSSLTYVGATNLEEFKEKAVVGVQTSQGFKESLPKLSF